MANKLEVVRKLKGGRSLVKVTTKIGDKYTFVKNGDICVLKDTDGDISGITFFDSYELNDDGEVIIKIFKSPNEWLRVLKEFDLSDAQATYTEVPGGPFNIGPYAKQYYDYKAPTKTVDDIVPKRLKYSYGIVNSDGVLTVYPQFDDMYFAGEGACVVGNLFCCGSCRYGYVDCTTGKAITPMAFEEAQPFSEERAAVKYNRRYGFIDRMKVMTDANENDQYAKGLIPRFYAVTPFQDGVTVATTSLGNIWEGASRLRLDRNGEFVSSAGRRRQYTKRRMEHNKKTESK